MWQWKLVTNDSKKNLLFRHSTCSRFSKTVFPAGNHMFKVNKNTRTRCETMRVIYRDVFCIVRSLLQTSEPFLPVIIRKIKAHFWNLDSDPWIYSRRTFFPISTSSVYKVYIPFRGIVQIQQSLGEKFQGLLKEKYFILWGYVSYFSGKKKLSSY